MPDGGSLPKVVLDTSIVLQAALSNLGPAFRVLRLLEEGLIEAFISPDVRDEYEDVLNRPRIRTKNPQLTATRVDALLARIDEKAHLVTRVDLIVGLPRDPNDEPILNLALQAQVDFIVARDKDLLDLASDLAFRSRFPFLKIVSPGEFLQETALGRVGEPRYE